MTSRRILDLRKRKEEKKKTDAKSRKKPKKKERNANDKVPRIILKAEETTVCI